MQDLEQEQPSTAMILKYENSQLSEFITDDVRYYWRAYDRWKSGKQPNKPDVNPDIERYWHEQSRIRRARKEQENRDFFNHAWLLQEKTDPNEKLDAWGTVEAAEFFGVTPSTIMNWCKKKGYLDWTQPMGEGGRVYITKASIIDLQEKAEKVQRELRRYWPKVVFNATHAGRQG